MTTSNPVPLLYYFLLLAFLYFLLGAVIGLQLPKIGLYVHFQRFLEVAVTNDTVYYCNVSGS